MRQSAMRQRVSGAPAILSLLGLFVGHEPAAADPAKNSIIIAVDSSTRERLPASNAVPAELTRRLAESLRAKGYTVTMAPKSASPGAKQPTPEVLAEAQKAADGKAPVIVVTALELQLTRAEGERGPSNMGLRVEAKGFAADGKRVIFDVPRETYEYQGLEEDCIRRPACIEETALELAQAFVEFYGPFIASALRPAP